MRTLALLLALCPAVALAQTMPRTDTEPTPAQAEAKAAQADTAAAAKPKHHARVELISSTKTIVPGKPFAVALRFTLDPKWHVYWKDPGDSGMPPEVRWKLPAGFTASELHYPTPEVLTIPAGVNYVYHDSVVLLATITPPADLKPGAAITLEGEARWLECDANQCLPGKDVVSAAVVVGSTEQPNSPAEFAAWAEAVRKGQSFEPKKG